jgi:hypothetical protein
MKMKKVMHLDLEHTGLAEYDIKDVKQWLHEGQRGERWIEGNRIYRRLKETDALQFCLGLRDLEEIQKKGPVFFRTYFKNKNCFGWKSVVQNYSKVQNRPNRLIVPYLYENDGEVLLPWYWLDFHWDADYPALRFV